MEKNGSLPRRIPVNLFYGLDFSRAGAPAQAAGTTEWAAQHNRLLHIRAARQPLAPTDRMWLENFERYVRKHLADDTLTVARLADACAMSASTLLRKVKCLTGQTPQQYLQKIRLDVARQLLETGRCRTVARLAFSVGYRDARAFSRCFRARFGSLPSVVLGE
ncbi:MAG: helix-turn-helix transcriptional regulator [Lewinellaceae bacterium]|nr:helix-turn-helix transcriptional regulator [Lewinellaceae bacterium]